MSWRADAEELNAVDVVHQVETRGGTDLGGAQEAFLWAEGDDRGVALSEELTAVHGRSVKPSLYPPASSTAHSGAVVPRTHSPGL